MRKGFLRGLKKEVFGGSRIRVYPGQYYDQESGLHYNYHRYYDPHTGRYLREDPIGIQGGMNHLYVYVQNNPIRYIDPRGLFYPPGTWDAFSSLQCINCDWGMLSWCLKQVPDPSLIKACQECVDNLNECYEICQGVKPYGKCVSWCMAGRLANQACANCIGGWAGGASECINAYCDFGTLVCGECEY